MGVVLISTIFFKLAGISNWKLLALIWAIVPILNTLVFARTPIAPIIEEGETGLTMKQLFSMKIFWIPLPDDAERRSQRTGREPVGLHLR